MTHITQIVKIKMILYKLIAENGNFWFYDPEINKFWDSNLIPLDFRKNSNYQLIKNSNPKTSKEYFLKQDQYNSLQKSDKYYPFSDEITDLVIQLGTKCNLKCIYCCQNINIKNDKEKIDINLFLSKLKNSSFNWKNLKTIQLWGGEPLVYWKYVKQIIEFIRNNIKDFNGYFHITTNGSLLDIQKVKFFEKYRVILQISHDGINQKKHRTEDWLDNPKVVEAVKYYCCEKHLGDINVTFGPVSNPNLIDTFKLFKEKLPGAVICCRAPLRCDSTNDFLLREYTQENIDIAKTSFFKLLCQKEGDEFFDACRPTRIRLSELARNLIFGGQNTNIKFNCPSLQRKIIHFNLKGELIPCHGLTKEMNCSFGSLDNLSECYITNFISISNRDMCKNCLYTHLCQGPCGIHSDVDAKIHCKSTRWIWEVWFAAIWYMLFNTKLIKVEKVSYDIFNSK